VLAPRCLSSACSLLPELCKKGKTRRCDGWCKPWAQRFPRRMCTWVKCQGCEGWEKKCNQP